MSTRSFASRFGTVARLLGMSTAAVTADEPADGAPPKNDADNDGEDQDGAANDAAGNDDGQDGGEAAGGANDDGDGDGDGDAAAGPLAGVTSAKAVPTQPQLMAAFEEDANRLVAAEQARCIAVFTSPAGASNPAGAAQVLAETDMSAEAAIKFLGTCGVKPSPRDRLNGSSAARPITGAATDTVAAATDPVQAQKDKRKARKAAGVKRGEKSVGPVDAK